MSYNSLEASIKNADTKNSVCFWFNSFTTENYSAFGAVHDKYTLSFSSFTDQVIFIDKDNLNGNGLVNKNLSLEQHDVTDNSSVSFLSRGQGPPYPIEIFIQTSRCTHYLSGFKNSFFGYIIEVNITCDYQTMLAQGHNISNQTIKGGKYTNLGFLIPPNWYILCIYIS